MFLKSVWPSIENYKFLKWLIPDLPAWKLAQPNPWLENYKFPQIVIQANTITAEYALSKCPFDLSLVFLKSDGCKSSIFLKLKRSTNLST